MSIIGAHISSAGGLSLSFERAKQINAAGTQIFISPPRQWFQNKHSKEEIQEYKDTQNISGIGPNFIHGTYLINLAAESPDHLQKSIDWLIYAMNTAGEMGSAGVIFHLGSHKGVGFEKVLAQISSALKTIMSSCSNSSSYLILENSAGAGGSIGSKFSELGQILKGVANPRLKICIDTCHAYASNYDLKTKQGIEKTLAEFEEEIGLENLVAFHANDSKFEIGSKKDRHENIGDGFIGVDGFTNLVNHPKLQNIPFILEVPGYEGKGPDLENVNRLKKLLNSK